MFSLNVEMFGLPQDIASLRNVRITLNDDAGISDLIAELRRKAPALEGPVIHTGEDRLTDRYGLNINGKFYRHGEEVKLKESDHVALLTIAGGG